MEGQKEIKILLVDDHKMMRDGLRNILKKHQDLTVIGEASNGKDAIEFVQENSPDVIIMDVNMPVMDGIKATKKIISSTPEATIIGLSLHESNSVKNNMLDAGASAYLTKNKTVVSLCDTIRKHVKSKRGPLKVN